MCHRVSLIIRAQDRQEDTREYYIEKNWAELFKSASLYKAVEQIREGKKTTRPTQV